MPEIRIPRRFLDDHAERDLPTPAHREVGRQYAIDTDDPAFGELVSDATYHAYDVDACERSLVQAAKALLLAVQYYR